MEETKLTIENESTVQQNVTDVQETMGVAEQTSAETGFQSQTTESEPKAATDQTPLSEGINTAFQAETSAASQFEKTEETNVADAPIAQVPPFVARSESAPINQAPQNNPNYSSMGDGMRRLKKVKRPVRRIPQGNPLSPMSSPSSMINLDENLDELLDSQLNLPVTNNTTQRMSSSQENPQLRAQQSYTPEQKTRPQPRFINDKDLVPQTSRFIDQLMIDNLFTYKGVAIISAIVFVVSLLIGMMMFGGETVVKDGLQGVIVNAEVPRGRARCGVAERTQGCVLYIMNPQRQDLQGRDFYDLASQLTGRQRFVIETGNMRYSNVKVRAGEIAQINIPPLQ